MHVLPHSNITVLLILTKKRKWKWKWKWMRCRILIEQYDCSQNTPTNSNKLPNRDRTDKEKVDRETVVKKVFGKFLHILADISP